jgi:hypothetical protein
MKKIKIILLVFLVIILILIAVGFYRIQGNPKVTVDYLAEYNRISQPVNYDPNQNSQKLYNEAIDTFFKMPRKLAKTSVEWPWDFNQAEQNLLQSWLIANRNSIQKFKEASKKPYFWIESRAFDNDLRGIKIFELYDLADLYNAILWNAKINAVNGKYSDAFEDLQAYYRASIQKCDTPRFIIVFRDSLQNLQRVTWTTLLIIEKSQVPVSILNSFQKDIDGIISYKLPPPDFTADKLFAYDILQRMYVYKSDGSGRLSWKGIKDISGHGLSCVVGFGETIKFFLAGPTQKEVEAQIDSYYKQVEEGFKMTPWQFHQTKPEFFVDQLDPLNFENLFLLVYGVIYRGDYYNYYNAQSQLKALVATIAILRFQQDKGRLPNNLDELIKDRYLKELPADPYSNKLLVYSANGEEFKIYSVGMNFTDDDGKQGTDDIVFWPPWERPKRTDPDQPLQSHSE